MIQTKVTSVEEKIEFRYDVNDKKDGIGKNDFISNIEMYIQKTSISYDPNSITTSKTNKKDSKVQVLGKFKIILLNKEARESEDIYIKLLGDLKNVFVINKIYNEEYNTSNYVMGTYINIGKIEGKFNGIDGKKEVEIIIEYIGNTPGDNIELQISAYEDEERFKISNMPIIKIGATYASLKAIVNIVDSSNNKKQEPINIISGDSIYYLTEIINEGNVDVDNTAFLQILDSNYCNIKEVRYGYDKNLSNVIIQNGNIVEFNINDIILANGGKYYVRVQATINL
ncbi:hypothetical protein [Clostridium sp.]